MVVLVRFPVGKSGKLLRDGLEETNYDPDRSGLHISAELVYSGSILKESQRPNLWRIIKAREALDLPERGNGSQTAFLPTLLTESKQG